MCFLTILDVWLIQDLLPHIGETFHSGWIIIIGPALTQNNETLSAPGLDVLFPQEAYLLI